MNSPRPFTMSNGTKLYPLDAFAAYMGVPVETCRDAFKGLHVPLLVRDVNGKKRYFYLGMALAMAIMSALEFGGPGFAMLEGVARGEYPEPECLPPELFEPQHQRRIMHIFERTLVEKGYRQRALLKQEMTEAYYRINKAITSRKAITEENYEGPAPNKDVVAESADDPQPPSDSNESGG